MGSSDEDGSDREGEEGNEGSVESTDQSTAADAAGEDSATAPGATDGAELDTVFDQFPELLTEA